MIFTRDFVTRENYWQIASLVTQKSLSTVIHVLFFMYRYAFASSVFVPHVILLELLETTQSALVLQITLHRRIRITDKNDIDKRDIVFVI